MKSELPDYPKGDVIYRNLDHTLDKTVLEQALNGKTIHQHSAWDFCGYIWFDSENNKWFEQVWRFGHPVGIFSNEKLDDVINEVNEKYGDA